MKKIIETDRLYLRHFIDGDTPDLFQLYNTAEVTRLIADKPFASSQDTQDYIANYCESVYSNPNTGAPTSLGHLAVMRKRDHVFLGCCGLTLNPSDNKLRLSFKFHKYFWHQGFATECTEAMSKYAFEELKLPLIHAFPHCENISSQNVLDKCGFEALSPKIQENLPCIVYRLKNPSYQLKRINALDTYAVRHPILRAERPLDTCAMEGDHNKSTIHLGVFYHDALVGVASFMKETHSLFNGSQARLRGMAVLSPYRKKGIARWLLSEGERLLKEEETTLLWFNARITALQFYKNLGYTTTGSIFEIPEVGQHFKMFKEL